MYIQSDNRSGSTLLDQLLGASDKVCSIGEIHHLAAYALQDRRLFDPRQALVCSCGKPLPECSFWQSVEQGLGRPLHTLRLNLRSLGSRHKRSGLMSLPRRLTRRYLAQNPRRISGPVTSRLLDATQAAVDSFELFDAIFGATGADYIVDSSKSAYRFRYLYDFAPESVYTILLARDYRATVFSKTRRGRGLESSIRGWAARMREMEILTEDVPDNRCIRLRYEDLYADPKDSMQTVCDFLGLQYSPDMLARPTGGVHNIGGSPSKFDPERRQIQLDTRFMNAFTSEELAFMRGIAGDAATRWGYD